MRKRRNVCRYIITVSVMVFFAVYLIACTEKDNNSNAIVNETNGRVDENETFELDVPSISSFNNKANGIKISWKKVKGAENYRIFKKSGQSEWEILADTTDNSFIDENVEKEKTYTYSVRCIDSEGVNYLSGYDDIGKSVIYRFFDTPELSSIKQVNDGIKIQWKKVDGINNYAIYRKEKDGDWKKTGTANETKYVDKEVESGKTYYYTVRCLNEDSSVIQSDFDHKGLSIKYVLLKNPVISNVENVDGGIKISWDQVKGAKKYRVFRKEKNDKWEKVLDTASTECLDEGVTDGKTYTYTVRCLSEDGDYYMSDYDKEGVTITYLK